MSSFSSWQFRTARPEFEPGESVEVYATGYDEESESLVARIGDSILSLPEGNPDQVDRRLQIEVEQFDSTTSTGTARILEVLADEGF